MTTPGDAAPHPLLDLPVSEHDGRTLDWRPQYDPRSRAYTMASAEQPPSAGILWRNGQVLDQGSEGACCGFAAAGELAAEPVPVPRITNGYALGVYRLAQRIDQWPGENYQGTSVLAVMKVLRSRGYCAGFTWAFTVAQLAAGLSTGPAVIGVEWRAGNYSTDQDAVLRPSGEVVGGHALLVLGFLPHGAQLEPDAWDALTRLRLADGARAVLEDDRERGVFVLLNSWGLTYGAGGLFLVPWSGMEQWRAAGWEAAQAQGRTRPSRKAVTDMADDDQPDTDDQPATADDPSQAAGDDGSTRTLELTAIELQEGDRVFLDDQLTAALDRESATVHGLQLTRGVVPQVRVTTVGATFTLRAGATVKVRRPVSD